MFPIRDHNPSGRTPYVTFALLAANIAIFCAYWLTMDDNQIGWFLYTWGLVPAQLMQGNGYVTLITHMFLHAGWLHLAGNMLFLWIYGDNLEEEMGHLGFLVFYIAAGLGAAALQSVADLGTDVPMVGASGAIAGVMGGYLLMFPRARVDVLFIFIIFFRIFAIPAWIVLGVWLGIQLVSGLAIPSADGVAYLAHIGGFAAGLILTIPVWLRRGAFSFWRNTAGHPPHPPVDYKLSKSRIPQIRR